MEITIEQIKANISKRQCLDYDDVCDSSVVDVLLPEVNRITKENEALKADQATRAEAVAALIRDCETAEKERDRLAKSLKGCTNTVIILLDKNQTLEEENKKNNADTVEKLDIDLDHWK